MKRALGIVFACGCGAGGASDEGGPTTGGASSSDATSSSSGSVDESSSSSGGEAQHPAVAAFWAAFLAEDYGALGQVIADLEAAIEVTPDDPELVLVGAHAHLWRLGEWSRDPDQDPTLQIVSAMGALEGFTRARELAPDDHRISCWLGVVEVNTGKVLGDQTMIDQGMADVDAAIAGFPEFALFCRMLVNEGEPYDSPAFQQAVDDVWTTLELCFGEDIDRDAPDLAAYLEQQSDTGPLRVCWNLTPQAVHNWQGFLLHAGDIVAKSGAVEAATALYEASMLIDWESWQHAELIESRVADVAGRAASYADADPDNDAELGAPAVSCTMCHGA